MGNSFNCTPIQYLNDIKINICFPYQYSEREVDQIIIDINNENLNMTKKTINKLDKIKKYFNENYQNDMDCLNKKVKNKKIIHKKKHNNDLNRLAENKYELMLKRLLEQKNIKRKGPKRRETIRNDNQIIKVNEIVNEILVENINDIKNNKIKQKLLNQENDLLIKNLNNQNFRFSATLNKNGILMNNINAKKYLYQYRNTINEIINESSGYSGLCTKQTKKTNSSKKKNNN